MGTPSFVIVGTPRSGTTLVQRLACELEGVRVPPETHFFTDFAWLFPKRWSFPLDEARLRDVLETYADRSYLRALDFEVNAVMGYLGGTCGSMIDLYGAIVAHLTGPAPLTGEKTPGHLLWWRPLATALPNLKLVCVIRDPRAVVASQMQLGWSRHYVMTSQRWRDDVRRVQEAARVLGEERCLVLRFEDVVASESATRAQLATFLDTRPLKRRASASPGPPMIAPWEGWKTAALEPADAARSAAWRHELSDRHVRHIEAICGEAMAEVGYAGAPGRGRALVSRALLPPAAQLRRVQHRVRRYRREHGVVTISREWRQLAVD